MKQFQKAKLSPKFTHIQQSIHTYFTRVYGFVNKRAKTATFQFRNQNNYAIIQTIKHKLYNRTDSN